ncbi:hypothetical protein IWX47DRAFT_528349 [Phyllosticta citricarpa]
MASISTLSTLLATARITKRSPTHKRCGRLMPFLRFCRPCATPLARTSSCPLPFLAWSATCLPSTPRQRPRLLRRSTLSTSCRTTSNRRDSCTKHHTDVVGSYNAVKKYLDMGLPKEKATMGFAFYAKYFSTDPTSGCATTPLGPNCKTEPLENADGSDNGKSGALPFDPSSLPGPGNLPTSNDGTCGATVKKSCAPPTCCSSGGYCGTSNDYCGLACIPGYGICSGESAVQSWSRAIANPKVDNQAGGHYYFDQLAELFWTWDEPVHIDAKFAQIVQGLGIKGVMAWSLSEDSGATSRPFSRM